MHTFLDLLIALAVVGTCSSTVFLGLVIAGWLKFRRDFHSQSASRNSLSDSQLPAVSILKPLHGSEPQLEENIESFFCQEYPRFEVLLYVDTEEDAALPIARKVCERHPEVSSRIMIGGNPLWPNPQMYAIAQMVEAAGSDILVSNDSDVIVNRTYLKSVVAPLLDPAVGMVTCIYRGLNTGGFWSLMDSMGMSVEMTAGVLVANLLEGMKFGLGPTIAIRRSVLADIGGCEVLGEYFSHDFMTGNLVASHGFQVVLSDYVISHVVAPMTWGRMWRKQVRWATGTKFSRPKGHFGEGLIYAMPYGILGLLASCLNSLPWLGAALLGAAVLNRLLEALIAGWFVVRDPDCLKSFWVYPVRDLLGFATWVASYLTERPSWRAGQFELIEGGKIALKTVEEPAQDGRGVKRATRRASEFLRCLVARIRVLCASKQ